MPSLAHLAQVVAGADALVHSALFVQLGPSSILITQKGTSIVVVLQPKASNVFALAAEGLSSETHNRNYRVQVALELINCISPAGWHWWMRADKSWPSGRFDFFQGFAKGPDNQILEWGKLHGIVHVDTLLAGFGDSVREYYPASDRNMMSLLTREPMPL